MSTLTPQLIRSSRSPSSWSRLVQIFVLSLGATACCAPPVLGVDYVWNQNAAAGPQEWNNGANWTPAGPPTGGDGNNAHIGLGGTAVIDTAGGPVNAIDSILFDDPLGGTVNQSDQTLNLSGTEAVVNPPRPGTLRIGVRVGTTNGFGTYNITGTGTLNAFNFNIGENGGSGAPVSTFNQGVVGDAGTTTVVLNNQGSVASSGEMFIGGAIGTGGNGGGNGVYNFNSGSFVMTGGGAENRSLIVGHNAGHGTLNIHGGSFIVQNGDMQLADNSNAIGSSVGVINQDGGEADYDMGVGNLGGNGNWVFVGGGGTGQGTYNLSGNGVMKTGGRLEIARTAATGTGTFNLSGNASVTNVAGLGGQNWLFVGDGGVGNFNQSGNTSVDTGRLIVGNSNTGIGHYTQTGGSLTSHNDLSLGDGGSATGDYTISGPSSGPGAVTITTGTQVENAQYNMGMLLGWNGAGTMNQNGGAITVGQAGVGFNGNNSATGIGTYNLSGGVLITPAIQKNNVGGTATFNFNGGTLRAVAPDPTHPEFARAVFMGPGDAAVGGAPLPALTAANVQAGGAKIDSNGLNIIISQPLLNGVAGTDGGLTLNDSNAAPGSLILTGANTYNGPTNVLAGTLVLGDPSGTQPGGALALQNSTLNLTVNNSVHLAPGLSPFTIGGLSGAANLLVQDTATAPVTLNIGNNNSNTQYVGVLSDGGVGSGVTKIGTGTLTLTNAQTYTGPTQINAGILKLASTASIAGNVVVGGANATGTPTLGGSGTVAGSLTVSAANGGAAGHVAPGDPSTLHVASATFGSGSMLDFAFGAPGSNDSIAITGALTLPTTGSVILNMTNSGSFGIGAYTLTTEGSTANFTASRISVGVGIPGFQETFALGGGGTSIVMNVTPADTWNPSAPNAADVNWSTPGNWLNGVPGSTSGTTNTDLAAFSAESNHGTTSGGGPFPIVVDAGRNVENIQFDQAAVGAYVIGSTGGNALLLTSGGRVLATALNGKPQTINAPLVLEGANGTYTFQSDSATAGNTLTFGGGITAGAAGNTILTLTGTNTGANTISGVIGDGAAAGTGGVSLFKSGAGTWVLSGNNTYTGGVTVDGGTLRVGNTGALNSAAPNNVSFTAVSTGTLALNGNNVTVASLNSVGTTGQVVDANAANATLTIATVGTPSYNAILADGTGGGKLNLTINAGPGASQTLAGNNTFSGTTNVIGAGTLILASTNALQNSTLNMTVAGSVVFNLGVTNFTLGGLSGNANLVLEDNGNAPINVSIGNNGTNTLYTGVLSDNGVGSTLIKVGAGTLTLTNVPTYTGTTTVSAGTLAFANAGAQTFGGTILGPGAVAANGPGVLTLTSGSSTWSGGLNVAAGIAVTAGPWQTTGSPTANPLGTGQVTLHAGSTLNLAGAGSALPPPFDPTQNYAAGVNIAGDSTVNVTGSATATMGTSSIGAALSLTGDPGASLSLGPTTLTAPAILNPAPTTTLTLGPTGESGGSQTLRKINTGTVTMASPGTYSGGTRIDQGTVNVASSKSLGTGLITMTGGKLALTPNTSPAIGINFIGGGNIGGGYPNPGSLNSLFPGSPAGVVPMTNWNDVDSATVSNTPGSGSNVNIDAPTAGTIVDSNGVATAATISFQSNNPWSVNNANSTSDANHVLMNGYLDLNFGGNNFTSVTLKGIPFASYDVYAYVGSDGNGRTGHGTIGSTSIYFMTNDNPLPAGNFVQATGTSVATANLADYLQFANIAGATLTYTEMGDNNNVGLHGLEIVNKDSQISMSNALAITGNANIDVTGAAAGAINGALSIGGQTLLVTGGSTGIDAPYTLTLGATTLSGNPTFDVANNGAGTGTLRLASLNDGGAARVITKVNAGTLEIQGASTLTAGTSILANVGTTRFNNTAGAATIGAGVTVTVASGATLELAGNVSDLSSPSPASARAHIVNNSKQSSGGSLLVSGTNQQVGAITGIGDTVVNASASLTANSIVQNALVIGGTDATHTGLVTIASSDASGNPLSGSGGGLAVAGSLAAGDSLGSDSASGSSALAASESPTDSGLGSAGSGSGTSSVPEPSAILLAVLGSIAGFASLLRRRRRQ